MPNHIGSSPMDKSTGPIIGTTTNVISIKSRTKPSKNITIITTKTAVKIPPGRSIRRDLTRSSPP